VGNGDANDTRPVTLSSTCRVVALIDCCVDNTFETIPDDDDDDDVSDDCCCCCGCVAAVVSVCDLRVLVTAVVIVVAVNAVAVGEGEAVATIENDDVVVFIAVVNVVVNDDAHAVDIPQVHVPFTHTDNRAGLKQLLP
jgi:hypothetical protein